jgi:hypothetical protein
MFTILRNPTKIHLDCFTWVTDLVKLYPILPAEQRLPGFFKKIPTTIKTPSGPHRGTLKTCPGVNDLFKQGLIIQAWSDIYLNWTSPNVYWEPQNSAESHSSLQWNNSSEFQEYYHFKLNSPWKFKEKTGAKFLMTNAHWHKNNSPYFVPNGVLEFKYQHTTNVNTWVNRNTFPKDTTISAGTELCQVIPLSDKQIVLHQHEISVDEYLKMQVVFYSFGAQYLKRRKILGGK